MESLNIGSMMGEKETFTLGNFQQKYLKSRPSFGKIEADNLSNGGLPNCLPLWVKHVSAVMLSISGPGQSLSLSAYLLVHSIRL